MAASTYVIIISVLIFAGTYLIQPIIRKSYSNLELAEFGLCSLESMIFFCRRIVGKYGGRNAEDVPGKEILNEYDFIVIGAGPSGSVVANRLSEVPEWKILLLEAGKDETFLNDIPAYSVFSEIGAQTWGYKTEPQDHACWAMTDRRCMWPRGKYLGGTSTINHMTYTRGNEHDFDEWARLGNEGWRYEDMLPYFTKSERVDIPDLNVSRYHGTSGNIYVEKLKVYTEVGSAFIDAGNELNYMSNPDYNGNDQTGFSHFQKTSHRSSRFSASKAFLRPIRQRVNLDVSLNSLVSRIVIDPVSKQASSVEFVKDGANYTVMARHEVVLSAGALNSPQILMLSGVGPRDHLEELGIPVIQDLKVGHNLQEHVGFMGLTFILNKTVSMTPALFPILKSLVDYVVDGTGPLALVTPSESLAFVKTRFADSDRPDVEFIFPSAGSNSHNRGALLKKVFGMSPEFYDNVYKPIENQDVFSILPILMRPKSRGIIRLVDKTPSSQPMFNPKMISDPHDVNVLIEGIKIGVELARTMAFQKYGARLYNVSLPGCPDVFGSDAFWRCSTKYLSVGMHDQVGTCKMGPPSDPDAVVDPELKVYGIGGLRVADASIIPLQVTGHTMAAAYMIGEKVSDLIKMKHKKSKVNETITDPDDVEPNFV